MGKLLAASRRSHPYILPATQTLPRRPITDTDKFRRWARSVVRPVAWSHTTSSLLNWRDMVFLGGLSDG